MEDRNISLNKATRESRVSNLLRKLPIARRLSLLALFSFVSFVIIVVILAINARIVFSSFDKLANDTTREIQIFNNLNLSIHELLSETREYALLREANTLDEIENTLKGMNESLVNLADIGASLEKEAEASKEAQNLEELQSQMIELESGINQTITLAQSGADEETIIKSVEDLEDIEQDILGILEIIDSDLQEESRSITTGILNQIITTVTLLVISSVLLLAINLGFSHFTTVSIVVPIEKLVDTSLQIADGDINIEADDEGKDEISILANAYNRMNARQREMLRAEELSAIGLQHTLDQIRASAEVAQAVSSILDPDELIARVVTMIRKAFDLYYVGVFVVDERKEWAVLRAGTGTAGQIMRERGHRIKIGEGMIGWSIANAKARIALEVEDDNIRLATTELPETKSELAVPLRSRGTVLGAFTVQDSQPNAFDEQSVTVLQQMADQVAIALENARLFAENQKALEASRQVSDEVSQEAWNQYLNATSDIDFLATPQSETQILEEEWQSEMVKTFQVGDITQHGAKTVHIPIILRNQTLGVVRLRKRDEMGSWSQEEIELMDTLVDRLETALETARLYSDTQRQAAHVSLTQEVTDKLHRSLNMDTLMQTLLQEVSSALGASDAFIQLSTPTQTSDSANHQGISTN